jgi:hypothetical protein
MQKPRSAIVTMNLFICPVCAKPNEPAHLTRGLQPERDGPGSRRGAFVSWALSLNASLSLSTANHTELYSGVQGRNVRAKSGAFFP